MRRKSDRSREWRMGELAEGVGSRTVRKEMRSKLKGLGKECLFKK